MGLEPISSHVKGECPNQLDERSNNIQIYKTFFIYPNYSTYFVQLSI